MESTVSCAGTIPLGGATQARMRFEHTAGQLIVRSGARPDVLLQGEFGETARMEIRREGPCLEAVVHTINGGWRALIDPAHWGRSRRPFDWDLELNPAIPLLLDFATAASKNSLDLSGLRATRITLKAELSDTELTLPAAAGSTVVKVHAKLADVRIRIPPSVAARILGKVGWGSLEIDQTRFHPAADGFESLDFATASNRVLLRVEGGLGSIRIR